MHRRTATLSAALLVSILAVPGVVSAAEPSAADAIGAYDEAVARGVGFLRAHGQAEDGSYSSFVGLGVTSLATTAILRHGYSPDDPLVARSLEFLEGFVHEDGGIYERGTFYRNYETCVAILCFAAANRDGRYDDLIAAADRFVKGIQWDESEGIEIDDPAYGGAGYGRHERPDLSNTGFLVEALVAAGNGPDDPHLQKALVFVSRTQNLETEHNTTPFAARNPDGGFYYTPAAGGESHAGTTPEGGLRSYGSMTYTGLKSMIYAGVGPDDPRVEAAYDWIRRHFDVTSNPGMGDAGLYYYYHTFAKALDAMGVDVVVDGEGVERDWRRELREEILRRQQPDGSWVNEEIRWLEGEPNLSTAYALLTLAYLDPREYL